MAIEINIILTRFPFLKKEFLDFKSNGTFCNSWFDGEWFINKVKLHLNLFLIFITVKSISGMIIKI